MVVEPTTEMIRHPAGRFIATPVARTNLHADLVGFLTETLWVEDGQTPTEGERIAVRDLANSLIVNVLDAHLDATYWQGRQVGYGERHDTLSVSDPSASLSLKPDPSGEPS